MEKKAKDMKWVLQILVCLASDDTKCGPFWFIRLLSDLLTLTIKS